MAAQLVTSQVLAKEFGVSRQAVEKAAKAGRLTAFEDGRFDMAVARVQWEANRKRRVARPEPSEPAEGRETPSAEGSDYWAHKTRREAAEAQLAELKLAESSGRLVARADVERASFTASRILRDQLAAASPRLAAAVMGLTDVVAIERTIAAEHRAVLETFCRMLRVEAPT